MAGRRFLTEIPTDHRTDWGEAAIRALGDALNQADPLHVEATVRKRRDSLEVVICGRSDAERIEISFWEDEATVRANSERRKFEVSEATDNWIPRLWTS